MNWIGGEIWRYVTDWRQTIGSIFARKSSSRPVPELVVWTLSRSGFNLDSRELKINLSESLELKRSRNVSHGKVHRLIVKLQVYAERLSVLSSGGPVKSALFCCSDEQLLNRQVPFDAARSKRPAKCRSNERFGGDVRS